MSDKTPSNKSDILEELESIKGLLHEDLEDIPTLEDSIPLLEDAVQFEPDVIPTLEPVLESPISTEPLQTEPFLVEPFHQIEHDQETSHQSLGNGNSEPDSKELTQQSTQENTLASPIENDFSILDTPMESFQEEAEKYQSTPQTDDTPVCTVPYKDPSVLPGQQSLFDIVGETPKKIDNTEKTETPALTDQVVKDTATTESKEVEETEEVKEINGSDASDKNPPDSTQQNPTLQGNTDAKKGAETGLKKPLGENPFLPKHIRDRLSSNQNKPKSPEPQLSPPPKTESSENPEVLPHHQKQVLIDSLVAEFLPKIEEELRKRLSESLNSTTSDPQGEE